MLPTLIVTRPQPQASAFAAALRSRLEPNVPCIVSPLLRIVPCAVDVDLGDIATFVFTSVNGVQQAARLGIAPGRLAWCVGDRTAQYALDAGFEVRTGLGTASKLVSELLQSRPIGPLAHIRGRHTRGDIAASLTRAGLPCADVVAYDQQALQLTPEAQSALAGRNPVLIPLFSARTATIFSQAAPFAAPVHVVAISPAVRQALSGLRLESVTMAEQPDGAAMMDATSGRIRGLK